jgi:hypothetical protein
LCSFNPRREHRFLTDIRVQEKRFIRQERGDAVHATEGKRGGFEQTLKTAFQDERWRRRKGVRDESADSLTADHRRLISTSIPTFHQGATPVKEK